MRVYILYEKEKKTLIVLAVGFLVSQAMNILNSVLSFIYVPGNIAPVRASGVKFYEYSAPSSMLWTFPAINGTELAYEILLIGLAIRYSIKHIPRHFWISPWTSTGILAAAVVRDNLVYFLISVLGIGFQMFIYIPSAGHSIIYGSVAQVLQIVFLCMIGPWMVLSLCSHYERDVNQGDPHDHGTEATIKFEHGPRSLGRLDVSSTGLA